MELNPNPKKNLIIELGGKKYARYPVKTHLITPSEDFSKVVLQYVKEFVQPEDIIFIGEKALAISQGRAYPKNEVKVGFLAKFLVKFVTKTPIGVGLSSPETMQLAVEEVGTPRILLAAFLAGLTKPFGVKGVFYMVAGDQARAIDGAADYVCPPYNTYVSKGPAGADDVAESISQKIGTPVAIVDANDFGVVILGACKNIDKNMKKFITAVIKDNPLGQTDEQTPIGIIREIK